MRGSGLFPYSGKINATMRNIAFIINPVSGDEKQNKRRIPKLIDKLLDKADFVTIRAGKIQDQIKGGRGKGLKRDNLFTNIIRSYTKSEW